MDPAVLAALRHIAHQAGIAGQDTATPAERRNETSPYAHLIPGNSSPVGDVQSNLDFARAGGQGFANWGMDTGRLQDWMMPIEGPSRALGAALQGRNPAQAARGAAGIEVSEGGGYKQADPTMGEVLAEDYGVHPIVAMLIDGAVTPDPIGAGRIADLVPIMGLLGPVGLRALMKYGDQIDFMPAGLLYGARGNELRRSPAAQSAFRREIMNSGGFNEPAVLVYDPSTRRYKVGEGNHRVYAAMEADSPIPVRVVRGTVADNEGMLLPEAGQRALDDIADKNYGYAPGSAHPGQLGLPTYSVEDILAYARRLSDDNLIPFTDADADEILAGLREMAEVNHVGPRVGDTLSRPSQAKPDFTPTFERAARESGWEGELEDWWRQLYDDLGPERRQEYVRNLTGLTDEEIASQLDFWGQTYKGRPDGHIPSAYIDPEFNNLADEGGFLLDQQADAQHTFDALADDGANLAGRGTNAPPVLGEELDRFIREADARIGDRFGLGGDDAEAAEKLDRFVALTDQMRNADGTIDPDDLMQAGIETGVDVDSIMNIDVPNYQIIDPALNLGEVDQMVQRVWDDSHARFLSENPDPQDFARAATSDPLMMRWYQLTYERYGPTGFWEELSEAGYTNDQIQAVEEILVGSSNGPANLGRVGNEAVSPGGDEWLDALGAQRFSLDDVDDVLARADVALIEFEADPGSVPEGAWELLEEIRAAEQAIIGMGPREDLFRPRLRLAEARKALSDRVNEAGLYLDDVASAGSTAGRLDDFLVDGMDGATRLDGQYNELGGEFGFASLEDAIGWLAAREGSEVNAEDFIRYLTDSAGLDETEAMKIQEIAWGSRLPLEVESDIQNMLGVGMTDRMTDLAIAIEEFEEVLEAGIMTDRTVAQADRLFAEISSVIDDLAPLVGHNDEATEVVEYLERIRDGVIRRVDPLGPARGLSDASLPANRLDDPTDFLNAFSRFSGNMPDSVRSNPAMRKLDRQLDMFASAYGESYFPADVNFDDAKEWMDIVFVELGPDEGNRLMRSLGFEAPFDATYSPTTRAWRYDWDSVGLDETLGDLERQLRPDEDAIRRANRWLRNQGIDPDDAP